MAKLFVRLSRSRADVVVFNSLEFIVPYCAFGWLLRGEICFVIHGWWEGTGGLSGALSRLVGARYVAVSETVRSISVLDKERVDVVRFGADAIFFESPAVVESRCQGPLRIGVVGRISREKNQALSVVAFAKIMDAHPDVMATYVGSIQDDKYFSEVCALVPERHKDRFDFVGEKEDMVSVYDSLDVVVIPSWFESLGMVTQEAMARGKVVVVTNVGAGPELVRHMETGLLFQSRDVDDLARCVKLVVDDVGLRVALGNKAREYAVEHFRGEKSARYFAGLCGM